MFPGCLRALARARMRREPSAEAKVCFERMVREPQLSGIRETEFWETEFQETECVRRRGRKTGVIRDDAPRLRTSSVQASSRVGAAPWRRSSFAVRSPQSSYDSGP